MMPIKRRKDRSKLVRQWTLTSVMERYYYHVFLWQNWKALKANTLETKKETLMACVCFNPYIMHGDSGEIIAYLKLGELHFVKDLWDREVLAHELMHACLHKLRVLPTLRYQAITCEADADEQICFEFGRWFSGLYDVMIKANPSGPEKAKYKVKQCTK